MEILSLLQFVFDRELGRLMLAMMAPLVIAALGELITERSGVLNVGVEGMMAVAAAAAFIVAFRTGSSLLGVLAGMLAGGLLAAVLAYYSIGLRCSQFTVGLSLFVFGLGLSSLLYRIVIGVRLSPPTVPVLPPLAVPGLRDLPIIGEVVFRQNVLLYVALVLVPVLSLLLFRTPIGLQLRGTGENPRALDAVGVDVFALRYGAAIGGGVLVGLAGAYLPLAITGSYTDGMVGGRGWIALMIVIFGRWSPTWILAGAVLFAYTEALQYKVAVVSKVVPSQFLLMLPYVVAILVLIRVYHGAEPPRALGIAYERESR
jgi:simple sugar transport system permease protein